MVGKSLHLNWGGLTDMGTWSKKVCREKSAEAIVVRTSCESRKERRAEQFYRYRNLDWEKAKDYWLNCEKVDTVSTRKKGSDKYVPKEYHR